MFKRFLATSTTQKVSYLLLALSAVMMALSVYMTVNVDVLDHWKLTMPSQVVHVGDEITVQSVYNKKMSVSGITTRYLDCKNDGGVVVRYELNKKVADRAARAGGTGIVVVIPPTVGDLPAKCRIAVVIDYQIFLFKHVIETNETEEFTLYPAEKSSVQPPSDAGLGTSQTQAQSLGQVSSSSSNTTPAGLITQSNTSQQPNIVDTILNFLGNL